MPSTPSRLTYVISDLHLGGEAPQGRRGFRLCTHEAELAGFIGELTALPRPGVELVINGDVVDFLAERTGDKEYPWSPFHFPESAALARLNDIVARSAQVFGALRRFTAEPGRRLVILPGNHDLELNLPAVRRRLREAVTGPGGAGDYEFIPHGEAYLAGRDALIEHGNRVDGMNFADYQSMRYVCELLSRSKAVKREFRFDPPAGSKLVAQVMNRIKEKYGFIDLLKPEIEAAFPVILALEPGKRGELTKIAAMLYEGRQRMGEQQARQTRPGAGGVGVAPISALESVPGAAKARTKGRPPARTPQDPLGDILKRTVGRRDFGKPLPARGKAGREEGLVQEIAVLDKARTFWSLLTGKRDETWRDRLFDLRDALLAFQGQDCFDCAVETLPEYLDEAKSLAQGPIRHVVFGHTHLAKDVKLDARGARYFNSGTWADLLELPREILDTSRTLTPLADLEAFVENLIKGDFSKYNTFRPTYVRIEQDEAGNTLAAELRDYKPGVPVR